MIKVTNGRTVKFTGKIKSAKNIQPFNDQCSHHIETSQLICSADQLTGCYIMGTLVVKGLKKKHATFA